METESKVSLEKIFDYLEALRESGATNMFGAAPYVEQEFGVSRREARELLLKWMASYPDGH